MSVISLQREYIIIGMLALHVTHVLDPMTPYIVSVIMRLYMSILTVLWMYLTHTHTNKQQYAMEQRCRVSWCLKRV